MQEKEMHARLIVWVDDQAPMLEQINYDVTGCDDCLTTAFVYILTSNSRIRKILTRAMTMYHSAVVRTQKFSDVPGIGPQVFLDETAHAEIHIKLNEKAGEGYHNVIEDAKWAGCPNCLAEGLSDLMVDSREFEGIMKRAVEMWVDKIAKLN